MAEQRKKLRLGELLIQQGLITAEFADQMIEEAHAKGIVTREEKAAMEKAKALRRQVVMVDDFPKDLGKTEIYQTTQPVTFDDLRYRTAFPDRDGHQANPAT